MNWRLSASSNIGSVHTGPTGEECITVADIATCACNGVVGHGLPVHWRIADRTPAEKAGRVPDLPVPSDN